MSRGVAVGKTELALNQFLHIVRSGHGGLSSFDPHLDAVKRVKACLTEPELAARVIELDLVGPRSRDGQPGMAPCLRARSLDPEAAERRVEAIVDSFASALQWGERNNRAPHAHDAGSRRADRASGRSARWSTADDLPKCRRCSATPTGSPPLSPFSTRKARSSSPSDSRGSARRRSHL